MNLFFLNIYLEDSAKCLCDKHVVKMILETTQMLYMVHHARALQFCGSYKPYRKSNHINHPMSRWMRECEANYTYACYYGLLICAEYTQRYGKYHACEPRLRELLAVGFPVKEKEEVAVKKAKPITFATHDIPHGVTAIPLCMDPEHYVQDENGNFLGIESYRKYYRTKQNDFTMAWKQNKPKWF